MQKMMFDTKYGLEQATIIGSKNQTRRIEKQLAVLPTQFGKDEYTVVHWQIDHFIVRYYWQGALIETYEVTPKYKVGEVVAIAQSYRSLGYDPMFCPPGIEDGVGGEEGWSNKMFVKGELMKNFIKITDVRLQRLQDITDEECLKEGVALFGKEDKLKVTAYYVSGMYQKYCRGILMTFHTPREAYAELIDRLSGKDTWKKNPWVLAYSFEKTERI